MASSTRDTDGENQCEKRDTVQRVPIEIENGQSQGECYGDCQQHNTRFTPTQRQRDQQGNGNRGKEEMLEEFVRFVLGRFPIVARDGNVQIVWQRVAPESIDLV